MRKTVSQRRMNSSAVVGGRLSHTSMCFVLGSILLRLCAAVAFSPASFLHRTLHISPKIYERRSVSFSSCGDSHYEFLGKGVDAVVREGCVLVAPLNEFNHYLFKSAVYIFDIGHSEEDDEGGKIVIRGVVLDNPTPFTIGETLSSSSTSDDSNKNNIRPLEDHLLFRGGGMGKEAILWFHSVKELMGSHADEEEIGTSGVYRGRSLSEAVDLLLRHQKGDEVYDIASNQFKFFFNYVEFGEDELEEMLQGESDSDDAWVSLQVPPNVVLDNKCDKNDSWMRLRNYIQQRVY